MIKSPDRDCRPVGPIAAAQSDRMGADHRLQRFSGRPVVANTKSGKRRPAAIGCTRIGTLIA